jgi:hypothetical protein
MADIYHRRQMAEELAERLINPGMLDRPLQSGLFLSGMRRTGKSTFLKEDLIPALERHGAIVIYVDLWENDTPDKAGMILNAIRAKLKELQGPVGTVLDVVKRVTKIGAKASVFSINMEVSKVGEKGGVTLPDAITKVVDKTKANVVLIVDEVQACLDTDSAQGLMRALKATRDAVNIRPDTPGHFLFIGTGSHRSMVNEMTQRRKEAFFGAATREYQMLDEGFVTWVLKDKSVSIKPSLATAVEAFRALGYRPEPFMESLEILNQVVKRGESADVAFRSIIWTKRAALADKEINELDRLGPLAQVIFGSIAAEEDGAKGLYAAEQLASYGRTLGRDVRTEEVQSKIQELVQVNLIMKRGYGTYEVTDPFVREVWIEREGNITI